ncbi:hypothetical protein [Streptomyces sp. NPDC002580]|uniref:hypothetical protein n=1 Tax=Streptomyces sp. NPDC002580 TaxID=3364653 RepID=UPI0036833978
MRGKQLTTVAALAAGTLAATGLAFAPAAAAVTPQSATINATCNIGGGGEATLTATQDSTAATITLSSTSITTPLPLAQNSVTSTLTLVNASGGTTAFSGKKNPAMAAGSGVSVGPLDGTVASGDSLETYGGSLKMVVFGITISCTANAPQSPGPFVFD